MTVAHTGTTPYTDFVARTCAPLDLACSAPLFEAATPSGFREAYLFVDFNFLGFIEIDHPDSLPVRFYPGPLWRSERLVSVSPRRDVYAALLDGVGLSVDPTRGYIAIQIEDCNELPAAGVSFAVAGAGVVDPPAAVYLDGLTPLVGATATNFTGRVFFPNVPAGTVTYTGTDTTSGVIVSRGSVEVRPDTATIVVATPTRVP
ncbi:MAG: hypothetical protein AAF715_03280 [Myxococcota bacterium]